MFSFVFKHCILPQLWDNGAALKSRALRHYKSVSETLPLLSIYIHSGPELIEEGNCNESIVFRCINNITFRLLLS